MEHTAEFASVILRGERTAMDLDLMEAEVLEAARKPKARAPEIRSLVLECTDLPPYAAVLQRELRIPIAELTTLSTMMHDVVTRQAYSGTT